MDVEPLRDAPLGRLVAMAGHLATRRWSQYLAEQHGLTPAGMAVLLALDKHGPLNHRELAHHCMVRPATLTGVIDTVERSGYVQRRRAGGDRRSVLVSLTGEGAARAQKVNTLIRSSGALTSVDAEPENAVVVRRFLLEFIEKVGGELEFLDQIDKQLEREGDPR